VTFPSIAWTPEGDVLVYEWNFDLWTLRPGTPPRKLEIRAPIDHLENFESDETRTSGPEEIAASRDGSWVAFTVAGDIFLAKTDFENGSLRVTDFPGADGDLAWHPNGEELAYVTQQPEQPGIWVHDAAAREGRLLVAADERYLDIVGYTADGTRLLYQRGSGADGVWSADPETGESELLVDLPDVLGVRVSPDGQWIAATVDHALSGRDIYIRPMDGGEWTNVTVHPDGNMQPYWAPDGSKLFFVSARTDQWQIYAVDLTPQPVEFEDYQAQFEEAEEDEGGDDQAPTERPEDWPEWKPVPIDEMPIELRDIEERAQRLSSSGQGEAILGFTADGERLVFERGGEVFTMGFEGEDETRILGDDGLSQAHLTADGAKVFAVRDGDIVHGGTAKPGGVAEVSFRVELDQDRRILQKAAFRQAWTIYDQAFYTGTFHGSDWEAVYEHYAAHCTGTLVQEDFNRLVNCMIGELNASHSGCFGGRGFPGDTTGRLGITRDPEHAGPGVRVAHVLRMGPLDHPNTRVRRGEYLLAINGQEVNNTEHFSELLAGTVGERVKVMVNAEPTLEGARELSVKPISPGAENGIEYRERIAARREQAHRLSDGRVYYLHISGMGPSQLDEFERELFGPAQHYDAVIIDVRDNGGGNIHDPLYEILTRRVHGWIAQRGAPLRSQPFQFFDGPLCVMTNQYSFSDAEIFPQGFQDKGLGAIIGMDTPGGVIGVGVARLVNGSAVAVPATGWYRLDEGTIENEGVRVDIEVPYTYAEYRRGRDPQLEAAVEYLLAELETRSRTRPPTVDGHVAPRP
jgi:tricorn protease